MEDTTKNTEPKLSVADQVLEEFVSALAGEAAISEVAERLRPVLLGVAPITEARLKQAIFGDPEI